MRFGLIGDVHAEDTRLDVALRALAAQHVDHVLCVGDIADGPGDLDRTCALLLAHRVTCVRGNHDRWLRADTMRQLPHAQFMMSLLPATVDLLTALQTTLFFDVPGGRLLLCHGVGDNDMQRLRPDDDGYALLSNADLSRVLADESICIMVGGHTHRPMVRSFDRGGRAKPLVVVNAGTLARDDEPCFVVLDVAGRYAQFYRIFDTVVRPSLRAHF